MAVNLKKAKALYNRYCAMPPDLEINEVIKLIDYTGLEYRSCKEGLMLYHSTGISQINVQHRKGKSGTVHRTTLRMVLNAVKGKLEL